MSKDYLKYYTDPVVKEIPSDYLPATQQSKRKAKAPIKQITGLRVIDKDFKAVSTAKDSDSDSEDEKALVIKDAGEDERLLFERRQARINSQSGWKDIDDTNKPAKDLQDISPPRRSKQQDISPRRSKQQQDLSPPRKSNLKMTTNDDGDDLSPPRMSRPQSKLRLAKNPQDISPPRRSKQQDISPRKIKQEQDISPPRKSKPQHQDISPPRGNSKTLLSTSTSTSTIKRELSTERDEGATRKRIKKESDTSKPLPTHGLFLGTGVNESEKKREKELAELRKMNPVSMGMGAATVYRDSRGKPLAMLNQMVAGPNTQSEEAGMRWGVGEVDEEQERREMEEIENESQRGFHAVYADDLKEDVELMERDRFGDPMAHINKKKSKVRTFKGAYPANRFNIAPGWRWDGIDRSNGFEAAIFKAANTKKANAQEEMYYAQEDM